MFLNDALAVIGVFLLGAAAGACLKYARYRSLIALCNQLLAETRPLQTGAGRLIAGHVGQPPGKERSTLHIARIGHVDLPVSFGTEFSNIERADLQLQPRQPER